VIIADRLLGRRNRWASTFDSNRVKPLAGRPVHPRPPGHKGSLFPELPRGEGRVLELGAEKTAAYKDGQGEVHAVSAFCTHLGCIVEWNGAEKTWDCPCHGSRFATEGHVLQGPVKKALPEVEVRRAGTPPPAVRADRP
jgi:Rieske Fe-S protein